MGLKRGCRAFQNDLRSLLIHRMTFKSCKTISIRILDVETELLRLGDLASKKYGDGFIGLVGPSRGFRGHYTVCMVALQSASPPAWNTGIGLLSNSAVGAGGLGGLRF